MAFGGDLEATYTLDDSQVRRGLGRVEQEAARHKERMARAGLGLEKAFGRADQLGKSALMGIAASVPIAITALGAYAAENDQAAAAVERLENANRKMLSSIGADLIPLVNDLATAWDFARGVRDANVNIIADTVSTSMTAISWLRRGMTGDFRMPAGEGADAVDEARKDQVTQERDITEELRQQAKLREAIARTIQALPDKRAGELTRIEADRQERLRGIGGLQEGATKNQIRRQIEAEAAARRMALDVEKGKEDAKTREAEDRARRALDVDLRRYAIDSDRLAGKEKEAAMDQERLEVEQKITAIRKDANLSDAQRTAAEAQLNQLLEARLGILSMDGLPKVGGTRIGLGQAGTGVASQIIGGGQSQAVDVQRRVLASSQEQTKVLKSIERKVGMSAVAVYQR